MPQNFDPGGNGEGGGVDIYGLDGSNAVSYQINIVCICIFATYPNYRKYGPCRLIPSNSRATIREIIENKNLY